MTQEEALEILKMGHNVFLTGSAGSGKTFLLNRYVEFLKRKGVGVGVTAPTGIAATHLEGRTIHSWSGIGIREELGDLKEILGKKYLRKRFKSVRVLVIDEISMLHPHRLDMVNRVCQAFKKSPLPFGGLQVVMSGDFFQLPPVKGEGFVDESDIWSKMELRICYLTEQHRQTDDGFLEALNSIRENRVNDSIVRLLKDRMDQEVGEATKLYTYNVNVDAVNMMRLSKIKEEEVSYKMTSRGKRAVVESLKKGCLAPENLVLKKGAVVMFVKNNFDKGYVNGTLGEVAGFDDGYPVVVTNKGKKIFVRSASWTIEEDQVVGEISQIPLRLAWAITVHKSQGMSLDVAEIDLSKAFVPGMGYVALSRVRRLDGIRLLGFNKTALQVNKRVLGLDKEFKEESKRRRERIKKMDQSQRENIKKEFLNRLK